MNKQERIVQYRTGINGWECKVEWVGMLGRVGVSGSGRTSVKHKKC